jgi:SAM-dependent methyltransferase
MSHAGAEAALKQANERASEGKACRCPTCGSPSNGEPVERSHDAGLYVCADCDLQFWYPVKMPGANWYEAVYQGRDNVAMPLEPGHLFFLSDPRAPKKGQLLDMGCGNGNFLAAARDAGFEVTGFEPDERAVQFAREHYGLTNVVACVPEVFRRDHSRETFDVVTFFEVLEHQESPQAFLDIAKSFVADGGYIALSVPNGTRWQIGPDSLDYPPNHLTRWSPRALQNLLKRNGLEVISIRQQPLTVRRAAQMLSGLFRTGMVSRVAGETPPVMSDFVDMPSDEAREKVKRLAGDPRQGLAARLAAWKSRLMFPVAFLLLPFLRLRGYTGLYLYCLVRHKRAPSGTQVTREFRAERSGTARNG